MVAKVRRIASPEPEELNCMRCNCWECGGVGFVDYGGFREDCDCIYYGEHEHEAKNCIENPNRTWMTVDETLTWLESIRLALEEEE